MTSPWVRIRSDIDGVVWSPVGLLITVNGTGVPDPWGPGFAGDVARGLINVADGLWDWQPIGYPAAVYPMQPSAMAARNDIIDQVKRRPKGFPKALAGYSQGAIVTGMVWRDDILNPQGALHDYKDDFVAIFNYGDPLRCPGIAHGNKLAEIPMPKKLDGHTTGGIAGPGCLKPEETPDFLYSFALDGDLYACAPTGDDPWHKETETGHDERIIYDAVMQFDGHDLMALAEELVDLVFMPFVHLVPLVQAIWNGMKFAAAGPAAPHWQYGPEVGPAVGWMVEHGNQLKVA